MKEKKNVLRADDLVPVERQEPKRDSAPTESIQTSELDGDAQKTRRAYLLSRATDQEIDEVIRKIEARIAKEDEIIIVKCSRSGCSFKGRNRRVKIGQSCPVCSKKIYVVEGEKPFVAGVQIEVVGKELKAFLEAEKKEAERYLKQIEEQKQAQAVLSKAGFYPRRDR